MARRRHTGVRFAVALVDDSVDSFADEEKMKAKFVNPFSIFILRLIHRTTIDRLMVAATCVWAIDFALHSMQND